MWKWPVVAESLPRVRADTCSRSVCKCDISRGITSSIRPFKQSRLPRSRQRQTTDRVEFSAQDRLETPRLRSSIIHECYGSTGIVEPKESARQQPTQEVQLTQSPNHAVSRTKIQKRLWIGTGWPSERGCCLRCKVSGGDELCPAKSSLCMGWGGGAASRFEHAVMLCYSCTSGQMGCSQPVS